ncbi:MAG: hypothetical protein KA207_02775 [Burkholderiaceae bacterium]|nr:hypothetical protein [Burkholderiaceae bacterium]
MKTDPSTQHSPGQESITLDDLFPIKDFAEAHPKLLNYRLLQWQLRNREANGLAPCCVKVGKKLLISKTRYEHWLSSQAGLPA